MVTPSSPLPPLLGALAVLLVVCVLTTARSRRRRVHLVRDALGNESLVLTGTVAGSHRAFFMIDTAYAGAPVLSTSYAAVQDRCRVPRLFLGGGGDVSEAYQRCLDLVRLQDENARHAGVHALLAEGRCRAFTSGCTMRLMSISDTAEAQADMLLCPGIQLEGSGIVDGGGAHVDADVMVTHPLPTSVHILTCDYLLHRSPCVLRPAAGALHLRLSPLEVLTMRPQFTFHPAHFVGGAFSVVLHVGSVALRIVVDTGAAAALSLSRRAVERLGPGDCERTNRRATQAGVHGTPVCSDVLLAPVRLGPLDLGIVEVFANTHDVEGADGYAGMGLLRAVDLWLEPHAIGFRPSGLAPRASGGTVDGVCDGGGRVGCRARVGI